ncbi:MAG: hypothetical protein Q8L48_37070 [Archangium sp.]|nr:hypothetical protein [Archangium sp.]
MHEHLRPAESASIDAQTRTRLEGRVELLEDSIFLFESVQRAAERVEQSPDDADTLREALSQLPVIDEALEAARSHEPLAPLVQLVGAKKQRVAAALRRRRGTSKTSLVEDLTAMEASVRGVRRPPARDEPRFLQSSIGGEVAFLLIGLLVGAYLFATLYWSGGRDRVPGAWMIGIAVMALTLVFSSRHPRWVLLADRFYAGGRNRLLRDVVLRAATPKRPAEVELPEITLTDPALYDLVALMRLPLLAGLVSRPTGKVTQTRDVLVLTTAEGVLTVRRDDGKRAVQRLLVTRHVTPHQLFAVLAHLPAGRLGAVAKALDDLATWSGQPAGPNP